MLKNYYNKKLIKNYSKWFQFLEKIRNYFLTIDLIIAVVSLLYQNNVWLMIAGFLFSVFDVVWLVTFFTETFRHAHRKKHGQQHSLSK